MAKIANWTRRQDLEDDKYLYIWHHDEKNARLEISSAADDGSGPYYITVFADGETKGTLDSGMTARREAYDKAVDYLKKDPYIQATRG